MYSGIAQLGQHLLQREEDIGGRCARGVFQRVNRALRDPHARLLLHRVGELLASRVPVGQPGAAFSNVP